MAMLSSWIWESLPTLGGALAAAGNESAGVSVRGIEIEPDQSVSEIYRQVGDDLAAELRDPLHAKDLAAEFGEDGGLVARAGADLQHRLRMVANDEVGHGRDHEGLRDGLVVADRQRGVLVGATCQRLVHEQVARGIPDHFQHGLVVNAFFPQARHQPVAGPLGSHADPLGRTVHPPGSDSQLAMRSMAA